MGVLAGSVLQWHRGSPVKRAIALVFVVLAAAGALAWRRTYHPRLEVSPRELTLPADGMRHRAVRAKLLRGGRLDAGEVVATGVPAQMLPDGAAGVAIEIQAPVNPGTEQLLLRFRGVATSVTIHFAPNAEDRFGDGTPDFLRLHTAADRAAFRGMVYGAGRYRRVASAGTPAARDRRLRGAAAVVLPRRAARSRRGVAGDHAAGDAAAAAFGRAVSRIR